jgi:large subunit ribosomal protein L7e
MEENRKEYFERAAKYVAEYIKTDRAIIDSKRKARSEGNIYVEAEPKVALVIRIKG